MIQLISRSGTLFSIIDGKEIVCKDQELARNLIIDGKTVDDNVLFQVPGYTVRVACKWDGNRAACGNEYCWDLNECQHNPEVAILSLEAPEKKKGNMTVEEYETQLAEKFAYEFEQPAQPVDRQWTDSYKLRALADWFDIHDRGKGRGILKGNEVQEDLRRIANYLAVSPSPERGESDDSWEQILTKYNESTEIFHVEDTLVMPWHPLEFKEWLKKYYSVPLPKPPKQ